MARRRGRRGGGSGSGTPPAVRGPIGAAVRRLPKPRTRRLNADTIEFEAGKPRRWNRTVNRKLLPNTNYVERHTGYRYRTDGKGRVSSFNGRLQLAHGHRNSYQQRVSGGTDRLSTDQGGHLFAHIFRGPGERINLLPMDQTINLSDWKKMENTWADALKAGRNVQVSGRAFYPPGTSSQRPSHLLVTYQIDNDPPVVVPFRNR
ncbi:DNA/RNA non-specific endonuclease [Micromonospora costi]|uniref:Type VII secretion system protein EssD-like domain-containing protein n=1 Tax=Micromonospora costi TaxID=1530042 RepID=A0A3A9ZV58_9ACTN|nr:DNA/RNA non-specific endonuclease [Micromonospora costi]RKN52050.1 hypothetical protein D7193_26110 [Micromonospora costi]